MKIADTTPRYIKQGRKYVPVSAQWYEDASSDQMAAGTFRLTYAYADGGRRYDYDVTPATAPAVAAMMIAKAAIVDAIRAKSQMRPGGTKYNKLQLAAIDRFKAEMGGMMPLWWSEACPYDIADAAIKAAMEFRP